MADYAMWDARIGQEQRTASRNVIEEFLRWLSRAWIGSREIRRRHQRIGDAGELGQVMKGYHV